MKHVSILSVLTLSAFILIACQSKDGSGENSDASSKWIQLFNGKNLDGWNIKISGHELGDNFNNTFRVTDGLLQVNYDEYDSFATSYGHIFYNKPYTNYKLRLQYRFIGKQVAGGQGWAEKNSGVMIHSQSPESMNIDQAFPVCIEVQLLGGVTENEDRPTGNLCTPGTHVVMNNQLIEKHCIYSSSKTYYGDEWIELEILVLNDSLISHMINGETVLSYSKPIIGGDFNALPSRDGEKLKSGYISLQSESHPIEFKNIELLVLEE
jgi:3-keto-disaccharide hydrolase